MSKILYVTNSSVPGGMEKHVLELIDTAKSAYDEVFVWCPSGTMATEYEIHGAKVTFRKIRFDIDPSYIFPLISFIKKNKIEIVHAHELKAVINASLASFFSGVKKRFSHTHTPISTWSVPFYKKLPTAFGYSIFVNLFSTKEIALTESIKKTKIKEGILENKIKVIPNGIDFEKLQIDETIRKNFRREIFTKYKINENSFVIGNLSRLTEEKGYEFLIRAFANLKKENKFLLIVGGGKNEEVYKKLIQDLNIGDKAVITGVFAEEDKVKFQSALDLLVFPSLTEGFGYVLAEAMAFGISALVSDLDVLKEVGGDTVSYFKTGDQKDLNEKLEDVINNIDSANTNIQRAKARIKNYYSLKKFKEEYIKLYKN